MGVETGRDAERQTLAVDRRDQISERAPEPAAAAGASRRFLVSIIAVSLLTHGCLVAAMMFLDRSDDPSRVALEIPVEVMKEPPPGPKPASPQTNESSAKPREAASSPDKEAQSAASQQTAKGGQEAHDKFAAKSKSDASVKPAHKEAAIVKLAHEKSSAAKLEGTPGSEKDANKNQGLGQTGLALPFDLGPDRFRAVAVPLPDESGGEAMSYKVIVFGLLARAKRYPDKAIRRGAKGIAVIRFALDDSGGVESVALLRSSGDADLDSESVALVSRAAPFPPPPPGAQRAFAAEVAFGMGR
jgi:periplasmic protein TonB